VLKIEGNTSVIISPNGTYYQDWKEKMENLIYVKEYWKLVFDEAKPVMNLMMNDGFFKLVGSFDNGLMTMF
jgi:hypothetical protein